MSRRRCSKKTAAELFGVGVYVAGLDLTVRRSDIGGAVVRRSSLCDVLVVCVRVFFSLLLFF